MSMSSRSPCEEEDSSGTRSPDSSSSLQPPKRPMSAYNLFYKEERVRIQALGKIRFSDLTKTVAARWRLLKDEDRRRFETLALEDQNSYKLKVKEWKRLKREAEREGKKKEPSRPVAESPEVNLSPLPLHAPSIALPNVYLLAVPFGAASSSCLTSSPGQRYRCRLQVEALPPTAPSSMDHQPGGPSPPSSQQNHHPVPDVNGLVHALDRESVEYLINIFRS